MATVNMDDTTHRPSADGKVEARCVLHGPGGMIESGRYVTRELAGGELMVETTLSCVSPGTELRRLSIADAEPEPGPYIPGYAKVGRVIAVGDGVDGEMVGRRLVVRGARDTGPYFKRWGGHQSHSVVVADEVLAIPEGVSDRDAVLARLGAIPMHGFRMAKPESADTVAVIGLGMIGIFAAKFYAAFGCETICIDRSEKRVGIARDWGLDAHAVRGAASARILERFAEGVHILVDATGVSAVAMDAIKALRIPAWGEPVVRPSRYVFQGSYPAEVALPYEAFFQCESHVLFPRDLHTVDIAVILDELAAGRLDFDALPVEEFDPSDAPRVYRELSEPDASNLTAFFRWSSS